MVDVAALTIYYCMASIAESHIGITMFHSYIIVGFFLHFLLKNFWKWQKKTTYTFYDICRTWRSKSIKMTVYMVFFIWKHVIWNMMLFGFREFNMRQLSSLEITGATGLGSTYKGGKLLLTCSWKKSRKLTIAVYFTFSHL